MGIFTLSFTGTVATVSATGLASSSAFCPSTFFFIGSCPGLTAFAVSEVDTVPASVTDGEDGRALGWPTV